MSRNALGERVLRMLGRFVYASIIVSACSLKGSDYLSAGSRGGGASAKGGEETQAGSGRGGAGGEDGGGETSAGAGGVSTENSTKNTGGETLGGAGTTGGTSSVVTTAMGGTTTTTTTTSPFCEGDSNVTGTSQRPQLTASSAQKYSIQNYLMNGGTTDAFAPDNWDPTPGLGDVFSFVPTYIVAADGSGTHTTIAEALSAAKTSPELTRAYILLKSGTYREVLCIDQDRPITLYGLDSDASRVTIVFGNNGGKASDSGVNPCAPQGSFTYGIPGSATLGINSKDVHLKNLSVINDFDEGADEWASGLQGAALYTQGDRLILENVRIIGNQSTTMFHSSSGKSIARGYLKESIVAGDVQFIVGRGTVVFDSCEIQLVTSRTKPPHGSIVAASTAAQNPYGMLFINSRFTVGPTTSTNWAVLGRSWDEGAATYVAGTSPNGQIIVRESMMASHIKKANPWGNAYESSRVFDCLGNRLYEFANTGDGAAL